MKRSGHFSLATHFFGTAESLAPVALPPFDYALALWQDGQRVGAKAVLQKILSQVPAHSDANNLLGVLYFEDEDMEPAKEHFMRAIEARPDWSAPYNNLGNIHRHKLETAEAEHYYREALRCKADYVEALTNLGVVLSFRGENEAAERYCQEAVDLAPGFAGAYCNLGNVLLSRGRSGEAIAAYREALRLQPGMVEALVNLALVLQDNTYLAGTIDYYEKQLVRQPDYYLANVRIGQALQALNRWDEARLRLERALALNPEAADALHILGVNYLFTGDVRSGLGWMRRELAVGPNSMAQIAMIYHTMYLEGYTGRQLCVEYRQWAEKYATRPMLPPPLLHHFQAERRIRVGYVSRDFALHSVAYFIEPILKQSDRSRFEIFCYSTLISEDAATPRFKALADNWRDISLLSENRVVSMIREDEIDILVDLSGHTVGNRLGVFAFKPAPIEITYLGHPSTTGVAAIDYRFGDAITDPSELIAGHYVERVWRLPGCFLTYQPSVDAPPVVPPPVLTKGTITFGSFNNAVKINDAVIAVWSKILAAVPTSRLFLKSHAFASSHGRARVLEGFLGHGIDQTRLELVDWRPDVANHLELYGEVDIGLDTFPYNGTTTSCEAFWMGVPVVCLRGERHSARVGASLLTALDMADLLATDTGEYVRIAVALAGDPSRLRSWRDGMREKMRNSALMDHAGFTRNLERAYQEMWREYCQHAGGSQPVAGPELSAMPPDEMFRLHIGGKERRSGWKVLNIQAGPAVDYLGDILDLSQFSDSLCDEIYASHVLEHVAQKQITGVMQNLFRMLKPGGCLRISVPDLEVLCRLYTEHSGKPEIRVHVMRMIFGGQTDPHDFHQVGFDFELLKAHLRGAGFERIERVADFNIFADTSRYAPYGVPISLNVIAYRPEEIPRANSHRVGKPTPP